MWWFIAERWAGVPVGVLGWRCTAKVEGGTCRGAARRRGEGSGFIGAIHGHVAACTVALGLAAGQVGVESSDLILLNFTKYYE